MLAVGQKFGIGRGNLFCVVEKVEGANLYCYVINGGWYFDLLPNGVMRIYTPGGARESHADRIYTDRRLQGIGGYNEGCEYLKTCRDRGALYRWLDDRVWIAQTQWRRFKKACWCAKEAFKLSWKPRKAGERMSEYEAFYDDIPF